MSSRTAAARKRLQDPLTKVSSSEQSSKSPVSPTTTRADLIPSTPDWHPIHTNTIHDPRRLDLSNEFIRTIPSPEYSRTYFPHSPPIHHTRLENIESSHALHLLSSDSSHSSHDSPFPHRQLSDIKPRRIESGQVRAVPTRGPFPHSRSGDDKKLKGIGSGQGVHTITTLGPLPHPPPIDIKPKRIGSGQTVQAISTLGPLPHPPSIDTKLKRIGSGQAVQAISTLGPLPHPPSIDTKLKRIGSGQAVQAISTLGPLPHPPSIDTKLKRIGSGQAVQAISTLGPLPHPPSIDTKLKRIGPGQSVRAMSTLAPLPNPQSSDTTLRRIGQGPPLRIDPHVLTYQPPPPPPIPRPNLASPANASLLSVPDLPYPPGYPPPSPTKYSGHFSFARSSASSSSPRPRSPTPSDLPEYRSTYSYAESHVGRPDSDTHTNAIHQLSWRDNRPTTSQYPPTSSRSSQSVPPHARQAHKSISPVNNENRLLHPIFPGTPTTLNFTSSPSSFLNPHELPGDSASVSGFSRTSTSTSTSTGGSWQPPAPPPSPNFVFPGSRSIARPKVTSKIANSQLKLRSKDRLRSGRGPPDISPDAQVGFGTVPESPIVQTPVQPNYPDEEDSLMFSDDYKGNIAPSLPKASTSTLVFPTGRSRAHPKLSSALRPSKDSIHSKDSTYSKSSTSSKNAKGRSRFMEILFKKKKKVKAPNITPVSNTFTIISSLVAETNETTETTETTESMISVEEHVSESAESNREITAKQERTNRIKSKRGSYPLDPYNSVLLDNDRHTGELLSRLNHTGSPSFHDYGDAPPSSVLDLGCGQGHWVLEAAVAWKEYGTHVTGYDLVDISRDLLPWANEHGVRDNIRFVRGNFLKQLLPFGNGTFDLVRMSCLALCITSDSWGFILQEVCRVLMAGGRLELIDDQIFFPYGNVSSLINFDDTNSIVESVAPRLDFVLSPTITTFSIYDDRVANPGLGSTVENRNSYEEKSDPDDEAITLHGRKNRIQVRKDVPTAQTRSKPSVSLSPEVWNRSRAISEDLEALFEHMLLDAFDIHKDPSDFIVSLMERVFGQAREVETMQIVVAPPDSTENSPQQGLSHSPGLILWPSTFIPMDHTEVEIHASKHLRTLLSCKTSLTQHAIDIAEDSRVDDEFVSEALWEYESFLGHRFNPPAPSGDELGEGSETNSIRDSIAESTTSESREAMWEIQSEFRQRFAWLPARGAPDTLDVEDDMPVRPPSPATPVATRSAGDDRFPRSSTPAPNEITHVRTFRVYEAIKVDNYILTYDAY